MAGIELTGSVLTALFVGLTWTLIKVVEFFLKRKPDSDKKDALVTEHAVLVGVSEKIDEMHKLHVVYDENHLPLWYVPRELLTLVRDTDRNVKTLESCIDEMRAGQITYMEKLSDLITSQTLLAQRIGDLIAKINRNIS